MCTNQNINHMNEVFSVGYFHLLLKKKKGTLEQVCMWSALVGESWMSEY